MGVFVSKLLSNDMRTLELMMSEIASAVRYGHWEVSGQTNKSNTHKRL